MKNIIEAITKKDGKDFKKKVISMYQSGSWNYETLAHSLKTTVEKIKSIIENK